MSSKIYPSSLTWLFIALISYYIDKLMIQKEVYIKRNFYYCHFRCAKPYLSGTISTFLLDKKLKNSGCS